MACSGILYVMTNQQVHRLFSAKDNDQLVDRVDQIGSELDDLHSQYLDKAWDAMHRCLSDGTLNVNGGAYPLNRCILGGQPLYSGEDWIVSLVPPSEVKVVASALAELTREAFHRRYVDLDFPNYQYGEKDEADFEYTWEYLQKVKAFYQRAASEERFVIFFADQ